MFKWQVLRLLRLLRVLKLVKTLPQLQVIVSGLLQGMSSIGYATVLHGPHTAGARPSHSRSTALTQPAHSPHNTAGATQRGLAEP